MKIGGILLLLLGGAGLACVQLLGGDEDPVFRAGGGPPSPGEPDASTPDAGPPGPWCKTRFPNDPCWDFDDESAGEGALTLGWESKWSAPGMGSLEISDASSPNGFRSIVTPSKHESFLGKTFDFTGQDTAVLRFYVNYAVCSLSGDTNLALSLLEFDDAAGFLDVYVSLSPNGELQSTFCAAADGPGGVDGRCLPYRTWGAPANRWAPVTIAVSFKTFEVSGDIAGTQLAPLKLPEGRRYDNLKISIGHRVLRGGVTSTECSALYDNVSLQLTH
jgi:hypothetical protein